MPTETEPIVLVEWFDDHWYKVSKDGFTHFLPSVTTKLGVVDKPGLARWRGDVGNREADLRMYDAGQRGKRIHWAWEMVLTGGVVIYDPWQIPVYTEEGIADLKAKYGDKVAILRTQEEMIQVVKLKKQYDALRPQVLGVEMKVYDIEARDAGTIDHIYEIETGMYHVSGTKPLPINKGIYIVDLKTGSYIDDNVWMQLAPYGYMYEKMTGKKIAGALVSHTSSSMKGNIPGLKTMIRDRKTLLEKDYPDYRHAVALWERNHEGESPVEMQFPSLITLGE